MADIDQPKQGSVEALVNEALTEHNLTAEDLAVLPLCQRYVDVKGAVWEPGKAAPPASVATVLFICEEGDDVRVYSAPVARADSSATDKELLAKGGRFTQFALWRLKRTAGSLSISVMPPDTFKTLLGRELSRMLEELDEDDGNDSEEMVAWLEAHPQASAKSALEAFERGDHLSDDDEAPAVQPNGAVSVEAAAAPATS
jgi:hypothetical protein